ncbi:hypothetical protein CVS40_1286 [Lucilia cuprina]|nr:hypothetical protein CVS40_1286 [Lucilia cuprina]
MISTSCYGTKSSIFSKSQMMSSTSIIITSQLSQFRGFIFSFLYFSSSSMSRTLQSICCFSFFSRGNALLMSYLKVKLLLQQPNVVEPITPPERQQQPQNVV